MFGFTGTPIFEENAGSNEYGKRTTTMLFDKCLHKYVITDAIRDENVLKFSVEYISTFKKKENIIDINVEDIDETEVMNSPTRLEGIVDYIIQNHDRKTHNRRFTSIFCVSSVSTLVEYFKIFNKKEHDLTLATIFTYQSNEEDKDTMGSFEDEFLTAAEPETEYVTQHSRDYLEDFIGDYNKTFGTNYTTKDNQSYYNYYNDIARRVKDKQVDVLLVVNMFLTGFDSPALNTMYVDKNLKHLTCTKCLIVFPQGSSNVYHCSFCDVCTEGHDHHCVWCSKCIAKGNMFFFSAFLFMTLCCVLGFWFNMISLILYQSPEI